MRPRKKWTRIREVTRPASRSSLERRTFCDNPKHGAATDKPVEGSHCHSAKMGEGPDGPLSKNNRIGYTSSQLLTVFLHSDKENMDLIDTHEATALLGFSRQWLWEQRKRNNIPHYKIGGRIRYLRKDLIDYVKRQKR